MVSQEQEKSLDVLETASDEGAYKPVRPLPLPSRKKKKKKKILPTDPDDPETDEDFDDEEDDDDDDDTETSSDTDSDAEDENELKQEEKKQESVFKNPFQFFKKPENMALKKGNNPEKPQRSPIQKFFDVLLYGVEGARIKNGDLPKQNITDELLLGLGFKAFLKDVLLGRQAAKYWKQKIAGKDNVSFLKTGLKGLKKQAMNDPAARVMVKDLNTKLKQDTKKIDLANLNSSVAKMSIDQKRQAERFQNDLMASKKESLLKTQKLNDADLKNILLKTEQEEKRILSAEKEKEMRQTKMNEQMAVLEQRAQENKQNKNIEASKIHEDMRVAKKTEQIVESQKQADEKNVKNTVQQNDKDQLLMQKNEMNVQRVQSMADMEGAALQAGRLAAAQMAVAVQATLQNQSVRNEMRNMLQQSIQNQNVQHQNVQQEKMNLAATPAPTPVQSSVPPAPVSADAKANQQDNERASDLRNTIRNNGNSVADVGRDETQVRSSEGRQDI